MNQMDWDKLKNITANVRHKVLIAHKPDYSTSIMTGQFNGIEPMWMLNNQAYLDDQARLRKEKEIGNFKEKLEKKLPHKQPRNGNKLKI